MKSMSKVRIIAECAVCIALATALSMFPSLLPFGGTVTPAATVPVIAITLRHGAKWGVASALVYSLLQLLLGLDNFAWLPRTAYHLVFCAMIDYVIAYTLIGFTGSIARVFKHRELGVTVGIIATGLGRYLCSVLSGVLLWGSWAWAGWGVVPYSFAYNALWCGPDVAIALIVCLVLVRIPALGLWRKRDSAAA